MTITSVQSTHVGISVPGLYRLSVRLRSADRRPFEALTRTLVGSPSPRDELAMISGGHVISVVQVVLPIADGRLEIGSDGTRAHAEQVLQSIRVG
jgi:hypothetical protein